MKKVLEIAFGLFVGMTLGFLIAGIGVVMFTDTTVAEFIDNMLSSLFDIRRLAVIVVAVVAGVVSVAISVPLHEAGHLLCGLLTGYKFVSFRIFNFTFVRIDGRLRIKRYAVAGTAGQCLLLPPDKSPEQIPTGWYNIGGVLANMLAVAVMLPLLLVEMPPLAAEAVMIFIIVNAFMLLLNGVPMRIGGVGNDGYNMRLLRCSSVSKQGFVSQLRSNAMIQAGVRLKDMPREWFVTEGEIDYGNALEVSLPVMQASILVDEGKNGEALAAFEALNARRESLISLYVNEIKCELVYLMLLAGRKEDAAALLDKELRKYISLYRNVMSSKQRVLCAEALLLDNDREGATAIYDNLYSHSSDYLLQGEVKSDLALMRAMLG
ncbi:MAG: hypothetical protein OSJ37_10220 [Muribaculaceae bacterium]|nr:hypothetical protein [Muribaculaceae bacterium]